jgi:cytochrome c-type biogenesis protein CcmH/NrfG
MGVMSWLILWPLAPVRGVVSLAELIQRRVNEELNNSATARRQLEELEEARGRGEISPEQEHQAQEQVLSRRIRSDASDRTSDEDG